ncbi:putative holin-like toxin [Psychrobacillus sp. FSL H8-0487]
MTIFQVLVIMISFATLIVSILALSYTFSQKK